MEKFDSYKLAIDARNKLNENYHKWMTFYYVVNGAIFFTLITIKTSKSEFILVVSLLSIIGILVSMFWNLSCKGYYYWSKSWVEIIIKHEKELISSKIIDLGVYSVFSKKVNNTKNNIFKLNDYANISTPKLTLIFSFLVILSWLIFSLFTFFNYYENIPHTCKIIISVLSILLLSIFYGVLLPKWTMSRIDNENLHNLI